MTELTGLHAKITGDASDLKGELKGAIGLVDQFGRRMTKTAEQTDRAARVSKSALTRLRRSIDPVYSASKKYESAVKTLNAQLSAGNINQAQYERLLEQTGNAMLGLTSATQSYNSQVRVSRFHTANVAAQLNDIGVMMASGQSPFILAIQQGTQLNQIWGNMSRAAVFETLAQGFRSIISPMSLLTIGLIAGGAALYQFGAAALGAKEDAEDFQDVIDSISSLNTRLKDTTELVNTSVRELTEEYGDLAESVVKLAVAQATLELEQANSRLRDQTYLVTDASDAFRLYAQQMNRTGIGAERFMKTVEANTELAVESLQTIAPIFKEIADSADMQEQRAGLIKLVEAMEELGEPLGKLPEEMQEALRLTIEYTREVDAATEAQKRLTRAVELRNQVLAEEQIGLDAFGGAGGGVRTKPDEDKPRRGRGRGDNTKSRLERLQEELMTELELEMKHQAEREELLRTALEKELITQQEYYDLMEQAKKQHNDRMIELDVWKHGSTLDKTEAFLGDMADALQGGNERMMQIGKAFGAAEALINAWRAFSQTLAEPGLSFWEKLPAALSLLSAGIGAMNAIKGVGKGGTGPQSAGSSGASTASSSPSSAPQQAVQQQRSVTIVGESISREQAFRLAEFMNDGTDDGLVLRGR